MGLQTILAVTDFSTEGELAVERAADLAQAHGACLRLLYAAERRNDAFTDPDARLQLRARQIARRHLVRVEALGHTGDWLADILRQAHSADLVVIDRRWRFPDAKWWQGRSIVRLLRTCPTALWVVHPRGPGLPQRSLVAIDGGEASEALVRRARQLVPNAEVDLFHAVKEPAGSFLSTDAAAQAVWQGCQRAAAEGRMRPVVDIADSYDTRRNRVATFLGRFDPASEIVAHQEYVGADLVVVGRSPSPWPQAGWRRPIAQRLVAQSGTDVLVVPRAAPVTGRDPVSMTSAVGVVERSVEGPAGGRSLGTELRRLAD